MRAYAVARERNNDASWKEAKKDKELLEDAIKARDKEINSLLVNILTAIGPEDKDYDIAVKTATNCRLIKINLMQIGETRF